jgi:hypothetical protein
MDVSDHEFQMELLRFLKQHYPHPVDGANIQGQFDRSDLMSMLCYLSGHGLIEFAHNELPGPKPITRIVHAGLTVAGIDYLEEDGGLTAKLGVVTVKFERETLRAILTEKISESSEPQPVKDRLTERIRHLPDQALSQLTHRLMEDLIARTPDLIALLRALI